MINYAPYFVWFVLAWGGWVIGFLCGKYIERNYWRDEMIRRKHASYNWMTGKWQWGIAQPSHLDSEKALYPRSSDKDEATLARFGKRP